MLANKSWGALSLRWKNTFQPEKCQVLFIKILAKQPNNIKEHLGSAWENL